MAAATLTIISRNYGSWSLRGWLVCQLAGFEVDVLTAAVDDEAARAELLLLSPSYLVPRLDDGDTTAWGAWAIAEHLDESTRRTRSSPPSSHIAPTADRYAARSCPASPTSAQHYQ